MDLQRSRRDIVKSIHEGIDTLVSMSYTDATQTFFMCHQSALAMGDATGGYLARILLNMTFIRSRSTLILEEDVARFFQRLANVDKQDDDFKAWSSYYAGLLGRRQGLSATESYLVKALELAKSQLLRYEVSMELGCVYVKSFRYEEAVKCFKIQKEAARREETKVYALFNLSLAFALSKQLEEAYEAQTELLNFATKGDSDFRTALAMKLTGITKFIEGNHTEAKVAHKEATNLMKTLATMNLDDYLQRYLLSDETANWMSPQRILMQIYCGLEISKIVERRFLEVRNGIILPLDDLSMSMVLEPDIRVWFDECLDYVEAKEYSGAMEICASYHQIALAMKDHSGTENARRTLVVVMRDLINDRSEAHDQIYLRSAEAYKMLLQFLVTTSEEDKAAWACFFIGDTLYEEDLECAIYWLEGCLERAKSDRLKFEAAWTLGELYASKLKMDESCRSYRIQDKAAAAMQSQGGELRAFALSNLCETFCHLGEVANAEAVIQDLANIAEQCGEETLIKALLTKAYGTFRQMVGHPLAMDSNIQALSLLRRLLPAVEKENAALSRYIEIGNPDKASYWNISITRRICLPRIAKAEYETLAGEGSSYASEFMVLANKCYECADREDLDEAMRYAKQMQEVSNGNPNDCAMALVLQSKLVLDGREDKLKIDEVRRQSVEGFLNEAEGLARSLPYRSPHLLRPVLRIQGLCHFLAHQWQHASAKLEESIHIFMDSETELCSLNRSRISYLETEKEVFRLLQASLFFDHLRNSDDESISSSFSKRALIWAERERSRDLLYSMKQLQPREKSADFDFDQDDTLAWKEIRSIIEDATEDVVFLVFSSLLDGDALIVCYFLHCSMEGVQVRHIEDIHEIIPTVTQKVREYIKEIQSEKGSVKYISDLEQLYELLIGPWKDNLELIQKKNSEQKKSTEPRSTRIIIVPTEELSLIPFHALWDGNNESYLIQEYEVSCVPSLRVFKECEIQRKRLARSARYSALLVGNPENALYKLRNLPSAEKEVEFVEKTLQDAGFDPVHVLKSAEASSEAVLELLPRSDWIHIASHGIINSDFPSGAIILAVQGGKGKLTMPLTLADLSISEHQGKYKSDLDAEEGGARSKMHGVLTRHDIEDFCQMTSRAAILSACSTGLGEVRGEGILGLPRSLHKLGVPSVLMSLWNVDDAKTFVLMSKLYGNLIKGCELSTAFRETLISMIEEEDSYHHPVYKLEHWASFILSGSPESKLIFVSPEVNQ